MNYFKKDSEFEGKLLYSIKIPQVGIIAHELLPYTDLEDWVILSYINRWERNKNAKKLTIGGEVFVWINYRHLIDSLPILKIQNKNAISKRIQKLEKLELIKRFRANDNSLYMKLSDLAWSVFNYHTQGEPTVLPELDSYPTIVGQPYPTGGGQSCPTELGQHNKESLIVNLDKESNKVESKNDALDAVCNTTFPPIDTKEHLDKQSPSRVLNVVVNDGAQDQENNDSNGLEKFPANNNTPNGPETSFADKGHQIVEVTATGDKPIVSRGFEQLCALKHKLQQDAKPDPQFTLVPYNDAELTPEQKEYADAFLERMKERNKQRLGVDRTLKRIDDPP